MNKSINTTSNTHVSNKRPTLLVMAGGFTCVVGHIFCAGEI